MRLKRRGPGLISRITRVGFALLLAVVAMFVGLFAFDTLAPPVSTLMLGRLLHGKSYRRDYVPLSEMAPVALATVLASEDARFCRNGGIDWSSLKEVIDQADADGPARGASTITMQTAKNLFLWPERSALRKGLEISVALLLGKTWSKARTLEVYLNIAEWGDGVFGIEAASQTAFGKSAKRLDAREAALLATALPNPHERDPADPEPFQQRLAANLMARARGMPDWLDCLPKANRYGGL